MLKGVTKRVIEINLSDSECFEKALLYVKPSSRFPPESEINTTVAKLCGTHLPKKRKRMLYAVLSVCLAITVAVLFFALIFL